MKGYIMSDTIDSADLEKRASELVDLARDAPARADILGWTNRIPELLMTHHVAISKAGGATTQAACWP